METIMIRATSPYNPLCGAIFAVAFISLVVASCASYLPDGTPRMNNTSSKIEALFKQTKTVCFGRFMIDLPESAQLIWGPMMVPYEMRTYPGEGSKIKDRIKSKVDEITSEKHREEPSMLIGVFDSVNLDSKIVVGYESKFYTTGAQLHSYIRLGNTAFVQSIPSASLVVTDKSTRAGIREDKTAYKEYLERLLIVARLLRLRDENEIPNEHGVCIEEGFIARSLDYRTEHIAIGLRFPEVPDVRLLVETESRNQPNEDDDLEYALRAGRRAGGLKGARFLRRNSRDIGQWKGAEALMRLPAKDGRLESHSFIFQTPGVGKDMLRPYVRIYLYSGVEKNSRGEVRPSLTDAEAVALWDRLTSTIRVRPVK